MTEFDFLDKQFHRLSEARQALARRSPQEADFSAIECWKLAMQGSIKDYLKMRAAQPAQPAQSEGGA